MEGINARGGSLYGNVDAPKKAYGFVGNSHLNISQDLHLNLWRFELTTTARDVLDHMTVTHDEQGIVKVTQVALATHFDCSQSKINRALTQLSGFHFAWKARRGQYQLNPTYAYRFSSAKHHKLLKKLESVLKTHTIVVPTRKRRPVR
ncbi:hypothetical protein [Streptomyces sp. NPDC090053]|uniref:hypothetical protein n=1 Tax=Streptomyces sp. NPDC090053 TaxID=3365932 RepID=UPI00382633F9